MKDRMRPRVGVLSKVIAFACGALVLHFTAAAFAADGREIYSQHCARCHGQTGNGDGPAHTLQRPRPRDFTQGRFKYRSTPAETLPAVDDVAGVIRRGILRSSMPPYAKILSEDEIRAAAEYVLELAKPSGVPAGGDRRFLKPPELDRTDEPALLARGKALYGQYRCASCHGADGRGLGELAGTLYDENGFWVSPADLTDPAAYGGGSAASDVYLRLVTGMPPSPMAAYAETAPPEDLAAIARYVKSLQVSPEARRPVSPEAWRAALPAKVRGEYLTRAMSCALCHNHYDAEGRYNPKAYLAGGVGIRLAGLGVFPTRNLTSHPEDGVGRWSEDQIVKAVTRGVAPDRRLEAFAMPWVFFSHLEAQDARDIAVFLKNLPPIANKIPPRKYDPFWKRLWVRVRQLLGFEYGRLEYPPGNVGT